MEKMMNYKQEFRALYLDKNISQYEKDSEIDFVIEMLTGLKSIDFIRGKSLDEDECQQITSVLKKRIKTNVPLQYLVGEAYFAGNRYFVDKHTLIPRPETEIAVEKSLSKFAKQESLKILDIGTGSGCISVELAKFYEKSEITACDISEKALAVAKKNACRYFVDSRINFVCSDVFSGITGNFNLIVSNPPYISKKDVNRVQGDVFAFEPHNALFADDDGLFFYKKIIKEAENYLLDKGYIVFELGENQSSEVADYFLQNGFVNIELTKDLDGINRVISAQKYLS